MRRLIVVVWRSGGVVWRLSGVGRHYVAFEWRCVMFELRCEAFNCHVKKRVAGLGVKVVTLRVHQGLATSMLQAAPRAV